MMKRSMMIAIMGLMTTGPAMASFDLRITEMWPGNEPGNNLTDDWFEITNFGDMAWTQGVDGDLYYDDDSADYTTADLISGITSIAPGESVIAIDGDAAEFVAVWGAANLVGVQIGTFGGSGLSQGGDAVTLWNTAAPPTAADSPTDFQSYPDADLFGGQSYDVVEGAFSGSLPGVLTSVVSNDVSQPAVGSPGYLIPEPASLGVFGLTAMVLLRRRDR